MLAVLIQHGEGEGVVVEPPVDRILAEVEQRVVHPPHVPLECESEAAVCDGPRHTGPGGGLFGDGDASRFLDANGFVELLEEFNRLEVLPASVLVAQPFARFAAVIQVEHRRNGVDA